MVRGEHTEFPLSRVDFPVDQIQYAGARRLSGRTCVEYLPDLFERETELLGTEDKREPLSLARAVQSIPRTAPWGRWKNPDFFVVADRFRTDAHLRSDGADPRHRWLICLSHEASPFEHKHLPLELPEASVPCQLVERRIKGTTTVCPQCLERVPGTVVERDRRVYLRRNCPSHGDTEALIASDAALYWTQTGGLSCGPGGCCGAATNHSCTLIFEITEHCNLTCPTCFTASSPHLTWSMPFEQFVAKLDRLRADGKADADIVQISGGEPTTHPEFERIVAHCFDSGVRKVYVNSNGVRFAADPALVERLAAIDAGQERLHIYLQFDGFADSTYAQIRGSKNLFPVKQRAIDNLLGAGIFVVPVMTVTRGINLGEIGAVVRMARQHHPLMNAVMLQPAFYAGRYENDRTAHRLTMAEIAHEVVAQTDGLFSLDDFGPIPCSSPNCFGMAVALVSDDRTLPVSRYFPRFEDWESPAVAPLVTQVRDRLPASMLEAVAETEALDLVLDLLGESDDSADWSSYRDFFIVGIKPFMDAHSYDQDRVDRCCVHVVDRAGQPVSLCEYNVLRRPRGLM